MDTPTTRADGKYVVATGFHLRPRITTVPPADNTRTVKTTRMRGWLELRYAPRKPKMADTNTSA